MVTVAHRLPTGNLFSAGRQKPGLHVPMNHLINDLRDCSDGSLSSQASAGVAVWEGWRSRVVISFPQMLVGRSARSRKMLPYHMGIGIPSPLQRRRLRDLERRRATLPDNEKVKKSVPLREKNRSQRQIMLSGSDTTNIIVSVPTAGFTIPWASRPWSQSMKSSKTGGRSWQIMAMHRDEENQSATCQESSAHSAPMHHIKRRVQNHWILPIFAQVLKMDVEIGASSVADTVAECGTNDSDTSESSSSELEIPDLQKSVDQIPQANLNLPGYQQRLGEALITRYWDEGNLPDLQVAVKHSQEVVGFTSEGHPDRARRLQNLSVFLTYRYQRLGDLSDLEAALQADQEAVGLTPEGHPERPGYLRNLAVSFMDRYRRLGDLGDLEAALQANQEAVELTPEGHPGRPGYLLNLAASYGNRHQRLGDLGDLEAALQANQGAVGLTPEGHPERPGRLQGLAVAFTDRYRRLGDLSDLEAALQANQEAVGLTPEGHPERPGCLQGLAMSFTDRYRRLGDLSDLEAALQANQEAVGLTPEGQPETPGRLRGLAMSFTDRYRRLGDLGDLEAALQADQEAVGLTPEGHPRRPDHLRNLAVSFMDRYRRLGDLGDLEAALRANQEAVGLTPEGHPERPGYLRNLAVSFMDRYQRLGDLGDLEAALQANQEAVGLTPEGHPERPGYLRNLAVSFMDRYQRLGDLGDLEAALQANQETIDTKGWVTWVISRLHCRPTRKQWGSPQKGTPKGLAISETSQYPSWIDTEGWVTWVISRLYCRLTRKQWGSPQKGTPKGLAIFKTLLFHSQTDIGRLAAQLLSNLEWQPFTGPLFHKNFTEIIEQGVGLTFQQMLQLKTDMDGLPPAQASKLQFLIRTDVANKRQIIIEDIRKQPGLEHFLLPKPYKILSHASQGGPVIILNSHQTCCDGIIILDPVSDPVHVSLPNVTLALLRSQQETLKQLLGHRNARTREESASTRLFGRRELFQSKTVEECFTDLLAWLYINVVAPVYQVLESHGIHNGRLWWLPTSAFTGLPLHACSPNNGFIHSYTATLASLLNAYSRKSSNPPKVGIVGVTHTSSGANHLPGVKKECLEGHQATPDAVKLQLQDCSWIHLACHGTQDLLDPTKSCLLLYQGVLELETILRMNLSTAEFVFLAACQTAMGDSQLVNESFHLGGGFIAAGFRSAIGTLWSMNDRDGPLVAEKVYSHLFQGGRQPQASDTAEALQLAVEELKAKKVPYERWIPFIHMGI
ncbi:CHAT domain-containing protein [Mycena vulgaris]|nr:CHAT domain-containing protein [Mycena vulgaris]